MAEEKIPNHTTDYLSLNSYKTRLAYFRIIIKVPLPSSNIKIVIPKARYAVQDTLFCRNSMYSET